MLDSHRRIQATSNDSRSLTESEGELRATLQLLEADLEDLEESVRVVESHGDRWGLAPTEVSERRAFVNSVTSEVAVGVNDGVLLTVATESRGAGCFAS